MSLTQNQKSDVCIHTNLKSQVYFCFLFFRNTTNLKHITYDPSQQVTHIWTEATHTLPAAAENSLTSAGYWCIQGAAAETREIERHLQTEREGRITPPLKDGLTNCRDLGQRDKVELSKEKPGGVMSSESNYLICDDFLFPPKNHFASDFTETLAD